MKEKLSNRIRPNSEVLPWIYEEIKILEKQNEAMREAIKEAYEALAKANDLLERAGREDGTTWEPGQSWIFWEDKCSAKNDVQSLRAAISKLQPFLNK